MKKHPWLAALLLLPAIGIALPAQEFHVARRIKVGGEGGWDYLTVDAPRHRLFLSRGTHVMVVDTEADRVIGDIPDTPGVHGVALAPELGRGFTSNGRDSSVTIFDYSSLATIGVVHGTGRNPDAILYDPATQRVFTFDGGSAGATVIDARAGTIVGHVALGGKPEAANADAGRIYVNVEDKGEVAVFDARTLAVVAHWPVPGCEEPTGQGMDHAHHRLFLACGNGVMAVVNAQTGALVATLPIGEGSDGAAFDPGLQLAFATNGGDGTVTVVHEDTPDRYSVRATVKTQRGARTVALDPRVHRLYTVTAEFGTPPAPTPERPRPRPPMVPGSFMVLVLER